MSSKKTKKEAPQAAGLWRGIAFGCLATLLFIAGGASLVIKNMPEKPLAQEAPTIVASETISADTESLKTKYIELAEVVVPLAEAFKLESKRSDMLLQAFQQVSQTTAVLSSKIEQLENAEPVIVEPEKEVRHFEKDVSLLFATYANGENIKPLLQKAISNAEKEVANQEVIEALQALLGLASTNTIQLTDIYMATDLLMPPTAEPADDISATEGWKARIGQLVTIRKITENVAPTDWLTTKQSLKKALVMRDLKTALLLAEQIDNTLVNTIVSYQNQQKAWQNFLTSYANEAK